MRSKQSLREPKINLCLLWNAHFHRRVRKIPPVLFFLNQTISIKPLLFYLLNSPLPTPKFIRFWFFINVLYDFLIPPICAMYPTHPISRDLIILIIPGEKRKLWSSLVHSFFSDFSYFCPWSKFQNIIFEPIYSVFLPEGARRNFTPI